MTHHAGQCHNFKARLLAFDMHHNYTL